MLEFLEDYIEQDPNQEFPQADFAAGKSVIRTGDAVADEWHKSMSEGQMPDFLSALDGSDRAMLERLMKKEKRPVVVPPSPDVTALEFHDDYSKEK